MNREQQPWEKRLPDTSQNITQTCSHPNIYMWDCRDEDEELRKTRRRKNSQWDVSKSGDVFR